MANFVRPQAIGKWDSLVRWWNRPDKALDTIVKCAGADDAQKKALYTAYDQLAYNESNIKVVNAMIMLWAHRAEGFAKLGQEGPKALFSDEGALLHAELQALTQERVRVLNQGGNPDLQAVRLFQKTLQQAQTMLDLGQTVELQASQPVAVDVAPLIKEGKVGSATADPREAHKNLPGLFTGKEVCYLNRGGRLDLGFNTKASISTLDNMVEHSADAALDQRLDTRGDNQYLDRLKLEIQVELAQIRDARQDPQDFLHPDERARVEQDQRAYFTPGHGRPSRFEAFIARKAQALSEELGEVHKLDYVKRKLLEALQNYSTQKRDDLNQRIPIHGQQYIELETRKKVLEVLKDNYNAHIDYADKITRLMNGENVADFHPIIDQPETIHTQVDYQTHLDLHGQRCEINFSQYPEYILDDLLSPQARAAGAAPFDWQDSRAHIQQDFTLQKYQERLTDRLRGANVVKMLRKNAEKSFRTNVLLAGIDRQFIRNRGDGAALVLFAQQRQDELDRRMQAFDSACDNLRVMATEIQQFREGDFSVSFSEAERDDLRDKMRHYSLHFTNLRRHVSQLLGTKDRSGTVLKELQDQKTDLTQKLNQRSELNLIASGSQGLLQGRQVADEDRFNDLLNPKNPNFSRLRQTAKSARDCARDIARYLGDQHRRAQDLDRARHEQYSSDSSGLRRPVALRPSRAAPTSPLTVRLRTPEPDFGASAAARPFRSLSQLGSLTPVNHLREPLLRPSTARTGRWAVSLSDSEEDSDVDAGGYGAPAAAAANPRHSLRARGHRRTRGPVDTSDLERKGDEDPSGWAASDLRDSSQ